MRLGLRKVVDRNRCGLAESPHGLAEVDEQPSDGMASPSSWAIIDAKIALIPALPPRDIAEVNRRRRNRG